MPSSSPGPTRSTWTPADIPDLTGRTALVTGATSGLGWWTALELARHGAAVLLTARDEAKGAEALRRLRAHDPRADADVVRLDLADLASVRAAAQGVRERAPRLDLLVLNAGVMAVPRRTTADGFELQLGTNHLGHVALTGLLLPALLAAGTPQRRSRVVAVSSAAHRMGRLSRDDLMGERSYQRWRAYGQSKLANLLFVQELHRRATAADAPLDALAAHPGYAATELQVRGPQMDGSALRERGARLLNALVGQSAERGAWPTLRAATDPGASGGEYFGPDGPGEARGAPHRVGMSAAALDPDDAAWLWQRSEELTGVRLDLRPAG